MQVDVSKGIQVGGYHYKVEYGETSDVVLRGNGHIGECDSFANIIRLHTKQSDEHMSETFLHEAMTLRLTHP